MSVANPSSPMRSTATPVAPRSGHEQAVDSLRGWAALSVFWMHNLIVLQLDRLPGGKYFGYFQADRAAVLLFFVISGYVIGLSTRRPWSPAEVRRYGWRRVVRLVPVYLLAVALGWIASPGIGFGNVAGHLAFLQDSNAGNPLAVDLLPGNTPLWSLHYEACFYLLFILWWRWPGTIAASLVAGLAAGVWATISRHGPDFVISHAVGMIYWLSGLLLSRCAQTAPSQPGGRIWANVCWLHAIYHFAPVALVLARLGIARENKTYLPLWDLAWFPLCLCLVAIAGGRRLPFARLWQLAGAGIAAAGLLMVLAAGKNLFEARWLFSTGWLAAGLLLYFAPTQTGLAAMARVGAFSYALYALHFPLFTLIAGAFLTPITPAATRLVVAAASWAMILPICWWLEVRLQPLLRARLDRWAGQST